MHVFCGDGILIKIEVVCNWLKIIDKKFFKKLTIVFCVVFGVTRKAPVR